MKAIVIREFGGPEVLRYEDWPDPEPGPNDVIVRVRAASVNHRDLWVRQGKRERGLPRVLGLDVAGEVVAAGAGAPIELVGQRVVLAPLLTCGQCAYCRTGADNCCEKLTFLGSGSDGGYAELVRVPAANCYPLPNGVTFEEAAALPTVYLTTWHMLATRVRLRAGETILIWGASSGVGTAAIQIATLLGARVITTAGSIEKAERARGLGVDDVILYREADVAAEVRRLTDGRGADVVLDHVGQATWAASMEALARKGRFITCGTTSGPSVELDLTRLFFRNQQVHGSIIGTRAEFADVLRLVGQGKLRPVLDRVYPLAEVSEAHRRMERGEHFGKIILRP